MREIEYTNGTIDRHIYEQGEQQLEEINKEFETLLKDTDVKRYSLFKNIGRNDLCPCKKEPRKKFKKCCLKHLKRGEK